MNSPATIIHDFDNTHHRAPVIALWKTCFSYDSAHNAPELSIDKKIAVADGLFFVATIGESIAGTIMAGYDGHRGWIYSLCVDPASRKQGIGSALLKHAEARLAALGCVKINLQIITGNEAVEAFYVSNGYATEKRISMGKRLVCGN